MQRARILKSLRRIGVEAAFDQLLECRSAVEQLEIELGRPCLRRSQRRRQELQRAFAGQHLIQVRADGVDAGGGRQEVVGLFAFGGTVACGPRPG